MGINSVNLNNAFSTFDGSYFNVSNDNPNHYFLRNYTNSMFDNNNNSNNYNTNLNISPTKDNRAFLTQQKDESNPFSSKKTVIENTPRQRQFILTSNDTTSKIPVNETNPKDSVLMCAAEAIPQLRRVSTLSDKLKDGDYATALGTLGLVAINFPEDCRDIKSATGQVNAWCHGLKPELSYDPKICQHPFSFFKGTLLKDFANPNNSKHPELASKLLKADITVSQSKIGRKILKLIGTTEIDEIKTKIEKIDSTKDCPKYIWARAYDGNFFGKLTARAMERTTIMGLGVMCLLELPKIAKAIFKGDTTKNKTKNGAKQIAKSTSNVLITTAGISYIGAIGMRFLGPIGSLVGMGVGAFAGNKISNKFQDLID